MLFAHQPKFPEGARPSLGTATLNGTGHTISSTRAKFGTYSIQGGNTASGNANYYKYDSYLCVMGANDYTIECWMYSTAKPTWSGGLITLTSSSGDAQKNSGTLFYNTNGTTGNVAWYNNGNDPTGNTLSVANNGSNQGNDSPTTGFPITLNQWNHIVYCREYVSGTNYYRFYINGVQQSYGTVARTSQIFQQIRIGYGFGGITGMQSTTWLDEVRISNGICRYPGGTTFTPSTTALVNDQNTTLLMHFENNRDDDATPAV